MFCSFLSWLCTRESDIKISDDLICAICLEKCNEFIKPCGHRYHYKCIKKWLMEKNKKKCPYCQGVYYGVGNLNNHRTILF